MKDFFSIRFAFVFACVVLVSFTACEKRRDPIKTEFEVESNFTQTNEIFFKKVGAAKGLVFEHEAGPVDKFFFPAVMCGGGGFIDFNNDGKLDILFVNGNKSQSQTKGDDSATNKLFKQLDDGTFEDVTSASGLGDNRYGMGLAVGDLNNDGFDDVYFSNYGADSLYINQEDGTFENLSQQAGIDNPLWSASVTFFDFDRDGWLDIYVTNYLDYFKSRICMANNGAPDFCGPSSFKGVPDRLYRNVTGENQGKLMFEDVSDRAGIAAFSGPGLGVVAQDFNADGWIDLYVANDGAANFLWINQKDSTFSEEAILTSSAFDVSGRSQAGMGIAVANLDDDQIPDLFVTHLDGENNAMYVSDEMGFEESANRMGLGKASYAFTGFGTTFFDLDHSGDLDLAVANGRVSRSKIKVIESDDFWTTYAERNLIFQRKANQYTAIQSKSDPWFQSKGTSRALAKGDVDNDGDIDLLVVNIGGKAELFENVADKKGEWIMFKVTDPKLGNRQVFDAKVKFQIGDKNFLATVNSCGSYCSAHDSRVHFAVPKSTSSIAKVNVVWPDGTEASFENLETGKLHLLERKRGQ